MNTPLRTELLTAPPAFHVWKGIPQTCGFEASTLKFIELTLARVGLIEGTAYEPGTGLSSVWVGELPS